MLRTPTLDMLNFMRVWPRMDICEENNSLGPGQAVGQCEKMVTTIFPFNCPGLIFLDCPVQPLKSTFSNET